MSDVKYKLLKSKSEDNDVYEDVELQTFEQISSDNHLAEEPDDNVHFPDIQCVCWINFRGYIFALLSCVFFATGSVFVKLLYGSMNSMFVVTIRSLIQLFCCIAVIYYKSLSVWLVHSNQTRILLLVRGTLGGGGLLFYFYAFQNMPIGDASAIIFSSPVYISFLAWLFLGESVGCVEIGTLFLTIVGVLLVAQPSFLFSNISVTANATNTTSHLTTVAGKTLNQTALNTVEQSKPVLSDGNRHLAILTAFLGSLCASFAFIALRKVPKVHFVLPIFYSSVAGIVVACVVLLARQNLTFPNDYSSWGLALMVGLCGICGQIFLTKAFQNEKAGPVSVIRQLDIVFAYIYQMALFHEQPHALNIAGALLVISGAVLLAIKKWMKSK